MKIETVANQHAYQQATKLANVRAEMPIEEKVQVTQKQRGLTLVSAIQETQGTQGAQEEKLKEQEIIHAIEKANKQFRTYDRRLEFSIHDTTHEIMVKVINTEDDSIIREIPSEKVLDMVAHMWEIVGILVDEKR